MKPINITIAGAGYVGFSLSLLLSKSGNQVKLFDTSIDVVNRINNGSSPIQSSQFNEAFNADTQISATIYEEEAFQNAEAIIICTPTNFDEDTLSFDTSSIQDVLEKVDLYSCDAKVLIKSTIPIGFTSKMQELFPNLSISFSPEFLREDSAIDDNLHPDRIIVSPPSSNSDYFLELLSSLSNKEETKRLIMDCNEAESVKLFSNTYLAMRVAFFNELDSYALENNLNSEDIIKGVSYDSRIGNFYNNPSFGYGGYCLPKDTKQLLSEFKNIKQSLIKSIVLANDTRKDFITDHIEKYNLQSLGIFRLLMKTHSQNSRSSAVIDIMSLIQDRRDITFYVYEPEIDGAIIEDQLRGLRNIIILDSIDEFIKNSDLILANRVGDEISNARSKVFTRDIFSNN